MKSKSAPPKITQSGESGLIVELKERAKELTCLYRIEEILSRTDLPVADVLQQVVDAIPPGWQYPEVCHALIRYGDQVFESKGFVHGSCQQSADLIVQEELVGYICVGYEKEMPPADRGAFLKEEVKLIQTIADRLSHFVFHSKLKQMFERKKIGGGESGQPLREWEVALSLLRRTDLKQYDRIARKMLNYLCWSGISEAQDLLQRHGEEHRSELVEESNRPSQKASRESLLHPQRTAFSLAAKYLSDGEILAQIQKWIHEDRASALVGPLLNMNSSWSEIHDAMRRFEHQTHEGLQISESTENGVRVALIKRFFSDGLDFVNVAKRFVDIEDFLKVLDRVIFTSASHGKLGGKSSGLFLAEKILAEYKARVPDLGEVQVPKTWYITSDGLIDFLNHNDLEESYQRRYQNIEKIRQDYPHLVQVFKHSTFSQELIKGLSMALDDFGDVPIIVRSSSLLEDRLGSVFSGKYKSLFLANGGTKKERLDALLDAIAEVYASTFGPDPLEYRKQRGLVDFDEEMGICIQEVVGTRVGPYYFPAFAGVALSQNEFRWSPRIRREDGLMRLVPGLGTRAVDRTEDYPILIAPGQPNLRANVSVDEIMRYSPSKIDVINLEENKFETLEIIDLLREYGDDYPNIEQIVSVYQDGMLRQTMDMITDYARDDLVVTFERLSRQNIMPKKISSILKVLQEALGTPVEIEFASQGDTFFLLQCRPQSRTRREAPVAIPRNVPDRDILFTAHRYVSTGCTPDISHIVYVDPEGYSRLQSKEEMLAVGRAVGRLNQVLPKRGFILMGPGRWGSRGDVKLGVRVTYADINNTAMLIEIARQKGNYVPDLSFGTHFFQDLVESSIYYLPLYPDDDGVQFNESFLADSPNLLTELIPEHAELSKTVRVIEVDDVVPGKVVRVLMNGDEEEAIGLLADGSTSLGVAAPSSDYTFRRSDDHWRWRLQMAERIAGALDAEKFAVQGFYVFGSTKNASAGPASDIDLLIHINGSDAQRCALEMWLQGWSLCLAEMNFLRTGYRSDGLLDVHFITDEDIAQNDSFAAKIGAVTDAARKIPLHRKG